MCQGPKNPFYADGITPGMRNTLGGSIERTNIADFHFEEQAQTFDTFGFAMDPSAAADSSLGSDVVRSTRSRNGTSRSANLRTPRLRRCWRGVEQH